MAILYMDQDKRPLNAATEQEMERLRRVEAARKKYDPGYITMAEASAIPPELLDENQGLAYRVRASADLWPENQMAASEVLKDLPGGAGETTEVQALDAEALFTGKPVGEE